MGWFEHQHFWRAKTDINKILDPETKLAQAILLLEDCACGAVRQIEFRPGADPTIRIAYPPKVKK